MINANDIWEMSPEQLTQEGHQIKPLWIVDFKDEEAILKWIASTVPALKDIHRDFCEIAYENLCLYKGYSSLDEIEKRDYFHNVNQKKSPNISVNMVYEFTDIWVNRMSQYKAKLTILPKNNDSTSRQNAKMKQLAIDDNFAKNNIDFQFQKLQLLSRIMGEGYLEVTWNPDLGDLSSEIKEAKKKGKKIVIDFEGEEIPLERDVRVGDIQYRILEPYRVLFELEDFDKLDWVIVIDYIEPEKLKSDFPDREITIKGNKFNNKIEVFTIYHRRTKYLPKGRMIQAIEGEVLVNTDLPYSHGELPLVRLTDIDVPTQSRASSFIEHIKTQQLLTNMVMGANWRNISLSSFAKWLIQKGTVNYRQLSNQSNVIEYSGSKPELAKYSGLNAESFTFIEVLRKQAEQMSRLQGVTLGAPPPNVRSGLQMAQLDEKQQSAISFDIAKRNFAIERTAKLALSIMQDYYKEEDGRLLRIVGKDKGHLVKALEISALEGEHTIEVKNNSGLPEGKFEKLSVLTDMRNTFGNEIVPDAVVMDAFSIGQVNRYTDYATVSVEKAESENEEMLEGIEPPEPQDYDDHLTEWKIHISALRHRSFADTPENVKELFKDHLTTTEYLMEKKATINPMFREKLMMLEGFPVFYTLAPSEAIPQQLAGQEDPNMGVAPQEEQVPQEIPQDDLPI